MIIKHKIGMELDRMDVDKEIYVMQDDKYSRELEIHLKANGKEYCPPENCMVLVRYEKPDGKGGAYDVLPDGRKAAEIHGNVVTVGLAPQVCTVAGRVVLTVTLRHKEKELSCFSICIHVQKSADSKLGSERYYHVRGFVPQPDRAVVGEYIKVADVDEQGRIVSVATALEVAKHGKSAYQYAREAGYEGTEAEFSAKLATKHEGIHIGTEAPTDDAVHLWIDTDEMSEETAGNQTGVQDVASARVGQIVRVAAVDGNSRPTAWEAVDYQPRTHYALPEKVLADNVKLTTGRVNWISYNIIKDYPTVTVVVAGNTFVCPVTRVDEFTQNGDESYFYIGNYNGAAPEYPFYLFGYIGNDFATVYPNSGYTVSVIANEYVCKLDEKYLPSTAGGSVASDWNAAEGEAGHIKNRTHWEEKRKTLLFEGDTDSYGNIDNPNVEDIFMIPGETYELEWDGVVYRDKARYLYEVLGIEPGSVHTLPNGSDYTVQKYNIVWGDLSYYFGGDPTMPLSIESTDEDMWVYNMGGVDGVRHIAIYNVYEIIQKLDPKFLPDMSMPFKYKRYILEYAASDLTPSGQTGFTASAAKQTEVGNLLAELSALTTIHMNMSVAVPGMGEIMRLPVLFKTKNEALGANGNISAVSYDGVVFLADEEVTTAALGSINIYKSGLMVAPADNYQAISMLGVKITLDVLYL